MFTFDVVFLDSCIGACTPLYLRLPEDGVSTPKRVGVFKPYVEFVNLLCAFVGMYDWYMALCIYVYIYIYLSKQQ
jgi:hypothetical protein